MLQRYFWLRAGNVRGLLDFIDPRLLEPTSFKSQERAHGGECSMCVSKLRVCERACESVCDIPVGVRGMWITSYRERMWRIWALLFTDTVVKRCACVLFTYWVSKYSFYYQNEVILASLLQRALWLFSSVCFTHWIENKCLWFLNLWGLWLKRSSILNLKTKTMSLGSRAS